MLDTSTRVHKYDASIDPRYPIPSVRASGNDNLRHHELRRGKSHRSGIRLPHGTRIGVRPMVAPAPIHDATPFAPRTPESTEPGFGSRFDALLTKYLNNAPILSFVDLSNAWSSLIHQYNDKIVRLKCIDSRLDSEDRNYLMNRSEHTGKTGSVGIETRRSH